ncbi:glutamate receptor ionotropic, delta-1-like isoform X2 [Rhodnius prolixus]|uniref:Ionotropic glutamate receptor C-terminal domain-containing protein n=1 Tax=Rhodnius prolixus TaxID=13249 RepID=A0A905QW80_RHOPR
MYITQVIIIICLLRSIEGRADQIQIYNTIKKLEHLSIDIIMNYMYDYKCVVWVREFEERESIWPVTLNSADVTPPIITISPSVNLSILMTDIFKFKCSGYVIQISDPGYFINHWEEERRLSLDRHKPRFLILPWNQSSPVADQFFNLPQTEFNSDFLLVEVMKGSEKKEEEDIFFKMFTNNFYEPFEIKNRISSIELGIWPSNEDVVWFPDKIANLHGKTIRVATLEYPLYTILEPLEGMEFKLLKEFCKFYNCSLGTVVDDYMWGEIWENKSGNGILGNVYMDKADFGTGAVYSWYNDYKFLDFSYPYLQSKVTVLVPKPKQLPEWRIPFNAFSPSMWAVQMMSIAFTAILIYFLNKNTKILTSGFWEERLGEFSTWSGVIMRSVGMALLQPPAGRLSSGSPLQRFFTLSEVLFLLFTTIYCGALSSILTVPEYYPPIDHPKDLYEAGIPWAADHEAWTYSLKGTSVSYLKGLVKTFEAHDTETLIELAKKGGYGFAIEIMAGGHVTHTAHLSGEMILGLHVMKHELYRTPSVTVLRKGSPYTQQLTDFIHRCLDGGLLLLWEDISLKFLSSRLQTALELSESSNHELNQPIKLKLNHVQGAFIILAIGSTISVFIFLGEKYIHLFCNKHQRFENTFKH